ADDALIFDLLEAEDIRYGAILAYNEPVGVYTGDRTRQSMPQLRGLGAASQRRRGDSRIVSGQEYRSRTYGHLNLYLRDDLVREGTKEPDVSGWFASCAAGRSFVTTGPLLLLDVDGQEPGAVLAKAGPGPHRVTVRVRTIALVAPVTSVQLLVNGRVVEEVTV